MCERFRCGGQDSLRRGYRTRKPCFGWTPTETPARFGDNKDNENNENRKETNMAETIRDRLTSVICEYLVEQESFGLDDAFETSCDLADDIFDEFLIEKMEQDMKGGWLVTEEPEEE